MSNDSLVCCQKVKVLTEDARGVMSGRNPFPPQLMCCWKFQYVLLRNSGDEKLISEIPASDLPKACLGAATHIHDILVQRTIPVINSPVRRPFDTKLSPSCDC
jgi:hypothetical protein